MNNPKKEDRATEEKKDTHNASVIQAYTMVSQLGFGMSVSIIGSFWVGHWLDGKLGTSPFLLILFTLGGVAASFKLLFDHAKKLSK